MAVSTAPAREKRRTTSRGTARKRRSRKNPTGLARWWPLLVAIAITPIAVHVASIMALAGPRAFLALYPWVLFLKSPAIGLANRLGESLSQLMMYLQFPIYGLLMSLKLGNRSIWIALALTVALHVVGILGIVITTARI